MIMIASPNQERSCLYQVTNMIVVFFSFDVLGISVFSFDKWLSLLSFPWSCSVFLLFCLFLCLYSISQTCQIFVLWFQDLSFNLKISYIKITINLSYMSYMNCYIPLDYFQHTYSPRALNFSSLSLKHVFLFDI